MKKKGSKDTVHQDEPESTLSILHLEFDGDSIRIYMRMQERIRYRITNFLSLSSFTKGYK